MSQNGQSWFEFYSLVGFFWAIFLNMGNPIHFATFRDTCQLRDITKFQQDKLFKFRKKFLSPCNPNFNISKDEKKVLTPPYPLNETSTARLYRKSPI